MCEVRTLHKVDHDARMKSIHDPRYIQLIESLRRVRKEKQLKQEDVAKRLKLDRTYVTKTETLIRRLDLVELYDWLVALDCDVEEYLIDFVSTLHNE